MVFSAVYSGQDDVIGGGRRGVGISTSSKVWTGASTRALVIAPILPMHIGDTSLPLYGVSTWFKVEKAWQKLIVIISKIFQPLVHLHQYHPRLPWALVDWWYFSVATVAVGTVQYLFEYCSVFLWVLFSIYLSAPSNPAWLPRYWHIYRLVSSLWCVRQ